MNRRVITGIIMLMSLSLCGIIGLQVYWIKNAIEVKEEQFDRSVSEALQEVADKMETQEAAKLVANRYLEFEQAHPGHPKLTPGKSNLLFHDDSLAEPLAAMQQVHLSKQREINQQARQILDSTRRTSVNQDVRVNQDEACGPGSRASQVTQLKAEGKAHQELKERYHKAERKTHKLKEVMGKMLVELSREEDSPEQRLNPAILDSLLKTELSSRGIHLAYSYGVVSSKPNGMMQLTSSSPDWDEQSSETKYKARLYPNSIFKAADFLQLNFPGRQKYVLHSLWGMLALSGIFSLIMVATFGSTLYHIFRQKKVSDIKTDFINNMTHEFKTPLATISVATNAINNPKVYQDPERLRHYTNIIKEENSRMNTQVEQVLRIALLDKKEMELQLTPTDAHELVQRAIQHIHLQVESRGGVIHQKLTATETTVLADQMHLLNVLTNLLDNANKYSPEIPDITVRTHTEKDCLVIEVRDKGMGMTREQQKHVFDRFFRVTTGNIHNIKGFGLGLSYVKAIVQGHKGQVLVQSDLGKGSCFILKLPLVPNELS